MLLNINLKKKKKKKILVESEVHLLNIKIYLLTFEDNSLSICNSFIEYIKVTFKDFYWILLQTSNHSYQTP